ncbi:unnamed protein product [Calypogeia fissa]
MRHVAFHMAAGQRPSSSPVRTLVTWSLVAGALDPRALAPRDMGRTGKTTRKDSSQVYSYIGRGTCDFRAMFRNVG